MRKVLNTNEQPFSVLLKDGGLHALYPGKPETIEVEETKVDYYKTKGFEFSELIEPENPKETAKEAAPAPAAPAAPAAEKTAAPAQPAVAPAAPASGVTIVGDAAKK